MDDSRQYATVFNCLIFSQTIQTVINKRIEKEAILQAGKNSKLALVGKDSDQPTKSTD